MLGQEVKSQEFATVLALEMSGLSIPAGKTGRFFWQFPFSKRLGVPSRTLCKLSCQPALPPFESKILQLKLHILGLDS